MTRIFRFTEGFLLAFLSFALSAQPAATDETGLTPGEIRALLLGNTVHGIGEESGWFFAIHYLPGGIALGKSGPTEDGAEFWHQQGEWEITGETGYCLTWRTWKRGKRRCMDMIPKDGRYEFRTRDGVLQSVADVLPGNPDDL